MAKKPTTKPDHAAEDDKPSVKDLPKIIKRNKIADLYDGGASIRQISAHLREQGMAGVGPTSVFNHLQESLEEEYSKLRLKARHMVQAELRKLQRVELAHFKRLCDATDADDIEKLSRAMERVWKRKDSLLGLHKPVKIDLGTNEHLAKILGRKPEELPSGDAES